jgi:hypothetical protein
MYAFHSILVHHLGTYDLRSLTPYGLDPVVDRLVQYALIDAFATQWWITSRAYGGLGVHKALDTSDDVYTHNMVDAESVLNLPYIKPYFDAERVWKAQGRHWSSPKDAICRVNTWQRQGQPIGNCQE